ncbi:lysophospholipid acyltransferase family protein [Spiroplasma culicicola]|uniref:1-acyl-sn-glycerol-3-phosphate acyltransferase n=1 Tax=Spiroplasma culicicola AES-1 TaxID=1276246 RepID=W6A7I0_9MOLU|nr:lysophospholipid acyltransferase family protein [Spiroplasma culicicola]AHI53098.1 1-acyl-sn-glycerol-3-phosphate acyltransferase [Spiroplasma culicicola AES-1]
MSTKKEVIVTNSNNTTQESINAGEKKSKYQISKARLFFSAWSIWRTVVKAKKITKRIKNDPNAYSEEYRYNWVKKKIRKVLKIGNVNIHVFGIENWLDRGIILAPNHQSNMDPILLMAINDFALQQPVAFIAKEELWSATIFKHFMNLTDNIPLDRKSPRSALNAMKEGKELINEYKRSVVVFPEGTRSRQQELQEFLGASMKLAQMSYAPIVPVTIIDSYKLYEKRPKGRLNIKVIFGKPLMPEKFISIKTDILTQNVKKEVQKNMDKYINVDLKDPKLKPKKIVKKDRTFFY